MLLLNEEWLYIITIIMGLGSIVANPDIKKVIGGPLYQKYSGEIC